jgi:linoleoyl-CoA desaturase
MEENEYPLPEEGGVVEDNFMVHQLKTTCNFAHKNRVFSWFVGGLNYQVEHHLFPNVCHVHYRKLSKIVEATAREYGIPYKSIKSFREALVLHGRMLYKLGRA